MQHSRCAKHFTQKNNRYFCSIDRLMLYEHHCHCSILLLFYKHHHLLLTFGKAANNLNNSILHKHSSHLMLFGQSPACHHSDHICHCMHLQSVFHSTSEVKNECSYTSTLPPKKIFMASTGTTLPYRSDLRVGFLGKRTVKLKPFPRPGILYCMSPAFCEDSSTSFTLCWPQNSWYLWFNGLGWSSGLGKNCWLSSQPSTN